MLECNVTADSEVIRVRIDGYGNKVLLTEVLAALIADITRAIAQCDGKEADLKDMVMVVTEAHTRAEELLLLGAKDA